MTAYATRSDVYKYGLPRGTLGMVARQVESSIAATNVITLDGHGFETDDQVILRAAEGGTMSAPLVTGTVYYVIRVTDSTFKLATTPAGSEINLTSDGVTMFVAAALPFDDVLEFYSRWVDGFLVGHTVPLDSPYPVVVTATVAELAAKKLMQLAGHVSATVNEYEDAAQKTLERWAKGIPLRDARATGSANKAVSSIAVSGHDSRGWGSDTLP